MKRSHLWMCATPAIVAALAACLMISGASMSASTQKPSGDTDGQTQQILDELRQIRQRLERALTAQPSPQRPAGDDRVSLPIVSGYVLGRPDAPLTMIEFTDLQCPFCRQFHAKTFPQLQKDYIDTGKLRYISRDFPLEDLHPLAAGAARASRCAAEQGKFWEMRHAILTHEAQADDRALATFAQALDLDGPRFQACVDDASRFSAAMLSDRADAASVGVSGTPTFVVGRTTASGIEGVRLVGAQPYVSFDAKLKALLAPQPTPPAAR